MFQRLLDLAFPPRCLHCKAFCDASYFCKNCWCNSSILDLEHRCIHCFETVEPPESLCVSCRHNPYLPFPRAAVFEIDAPILALKGRDAGQAMAGFAYYQWLRLGWKKPDLIVPTLPNRSAVGRFFAELCDCPCPNLFRRIAWPLGTETLEIRDFLEEDLSILLVDDGCTPKQRQLACSAISHAFPKSVHIISLIL